jgi:hypothetical protein
VPFRLYLLQRRAHLSVARQKLKQNILRSVSIINSTSNKEAPPQQCKESIIVCARDKGDKTDSSNYWGISLLSTAYTMLSNILLSRLTLNVYKIIRHYQSGLQHNTSTTVRYSAFTQYLRKNRNKVQQYISYLYTSRKPIIQLGENFCVIFPLSLVHP